MNLSLDCIPCIIEQALAAARFASNDPGVHEQVLHAALRMAAKADGRLSPPALGQQIHRVIRHLSQKTDPYAAVKEQCNQLGARLLPALRQKIALSSSPFETAVRIAIAGNVIDFALNPHLGEEDILKSLDDLLSFPLQERAEMLQDCSRRASLILYLADNAGEIFFDRLLIEQFPAGKVIVAVRGAPVINDATREDARAAGIEKVANLIDNGSDAPGTLLEDCSSQFRKLFDKADLIISKGQGNYETLYPSNRDIFYLLKMKCAYVSSFLGRPLNSGVFVRSCSAVEKK